MSALIFSFPNVLISGRVALKAKTRRDDASVHRIASEIETERLKLRAEIGVWRDDQALYMPDVLQHASEAQNPEEERLFLPSGVRRGLRKAAWFDALSTFERELRKGQADDALSNLRLALKYKDSLLKGRRRVAYGNKNSTRAAVLLRRVEDLVQHRANTYRRARDAMIALGLSTNDTSFPVLDPTDVVLKVVYGGKELGSGVYTGSWIWTDGPRGILSDAEEDEWEEEGTSIPFLEMNILNSCYVGNKVEWFRAKIDLQQWREESEILDEELKRSARWFGNKSELWNTLASRVLPAPRGFSEYACHKADMFLRRSTEVIEYHNWALTVDIHAKENTSSK